MPRLDQEAFSVGFALGNKAFKGSSVLAVDGQAVLFEFQNGIEEGARFNRFEEVIDAVDLESAQSIFVVRGE